MISPAYPKLDNSAYAFVHVRAKIYRKKGHKVTVFIPSTHNSKYEFEGIPVNQGNNEVYETILKNFDPDIVALHAPNYLTNKDQLKKLDRNKRPIVTWIHGTEVLPCILHHYYAPWNLKARINSIVHDPLKIVLLRCLILKSNSVIYVSRWMKKYAERYLLFKHHFSAVIPNPVDTNLFSFKRRSKEVMREGLAVRSLGWKYGLDTAVRAYSNFRKAHLTILGSGPLEAYLRNLSKKCQANVSFVTKRVNHNEMPDVYHKFGYFVAPSRTEAQGVAMCEAMACGLPVIATMVGGIPEFIQNEVNGLLVPPEKPLALRKAVVRLLTNKPLYDTLSEKGAKFAKQKLSSELIYLKEYEIFKICMEESMD